MLVHDCQKIDLQLALISEESDEATQTALTLLRDAQSLENEVEELTETIEQHQTVYEYGTATAGTSDPDKIEQEQAQLDLLNEQITTLQKDAMSKVSKSL